MRSGILVGIGAAACVAAVAAGILRPDLPLPRQKILILAAEYLILLPALLVAARLGRWPAPAGRPASSAGFRMIAVTYLLLLIPIAASVRPGIFSADESTYLFEARCLAAGSLSAPAPPIPERDIHFTHNLFVGQRWFGKYPFAWPALLRAAGALRMEWLLNPLLGLALLWLSYRIGAALFGPRAACWGALLLSASPMFTLNCLGYMSHVACGLAVAGAAWFYLRSVERTSALAIAVAGASVAAAILIRPFTGACIGAVLGAAILLEFRSRPRVLAAGAAAALALAAATVWITGTLNRRVTGSFLRSAYAAYHHQAAVPDEVSLAPAVLAHNLAVITPVRLVDTVAAAFPFLFLPALWGLWRFRKDRRVIVLALLFATLVLGHAVQQEGSDSPIGERYFFEGFFAVALLAGAGVSELEAVSNAALRRSVLVSTAIAGAALWVFFAHEQIEARHPYREIALAAESPPVSSGIVFLAVAPHYEPPAYNPNQPGGKLLFLPAPPDGRASQIAARLGQRHWAELTYDPASRRARWKLPAAGHVQ